MSNRYARVLAAGCAAVLAATLGVTPALAATTWTIQPGGAITATSSSQFILKDIKTGSVLTCFTVTASGTFKRGSGLPGSHAGSLSAASFGHCAGADGPVFTLQPSGLPWHVNLSSYNAATGVVTGTVSHIQIIVSGVCSAVIDGTGATASDGRLRFTYTDGTGQLTVLATSGNLHFYDVSGCLGLFNDGDRATLGATYTVSPKQAITSP
jgi:hypothetical protein